MARISEIAARVLACDFNCEAGPLAMCRDWQNLIAEAELQAAREVMDKLAANLKAFVDAFDAGSLQMNSEEIGEPESGVPYHPWHEDALHYARNALVAYDALKGGENGA